jgi:hypothetical protein
MKDASGRFHTVNFFSEIWFGVPPRHGKTVQEKNAISLSDSTPAFSE